jgi:hypothetical protein
LFAGKIPNLKMGYLTTPANSVELNGKGTPDKLEALTYYLYKEYQDPDPTAYFVAFVSESDDWTFEKENNLSVLADKQKLSLGNAFRLYRQNGKKVQELLLYKVERSTLQKIAKAKSFSLQIGKYSGKIGDGLQKSLSELLETTNY